MLGFTKSPRAERDPPRFAKPRWTTSSAEWQRLDAQLPGEPTGVQSGAVQLAYDVFARNNDAGYVKARQLAFCAAEHIDLYGPWQERDLGLDREIRQPARRLSKEAFTWEEDARQYRCPEGHPLTHIGKETKPQSDGEPHVEFRFRCSPAHCSSCTRKQECTANPKRGRSLRRSEHHPSLIGIARE